MRFRSQSFILVAALLLGAASFGFASSGCKPQQGTQPVDDVDDQVCTAEDCGPKPEMANVLCPDGVTMSGPGECMATDDGCAWDIIECPKDVQPIACGGIAGKQCPVGQTCVDDPNDDCDPNEGGADCGGTCQAQY
jgi:hypothetical protein